MSTDLYLDLAAALLLSLVAVPVSQRLSARVHPRRASRVLVAVALLAALASTGALTALAVAVVVGAVPLVPGGAACVVLVVLLGRLAVVAVDRGRALARCAKALRGSAVHGDLQVLAEERAFACAVPGRPGRVVVSSGMLRALDATGRRALLAHERAHLVGRHHRLVIAGDLAAAVNPLVSPLRAAIRYAVERSADEAAAEQVGDRRAVAHAVAKAALVGLGASWGSPVALGAATGPVPRRVKALLDTGPAPRAGIWAVLALLLLGLALALVTDAAVDLHEVTVQASSPLA
ncbi:hypothetical protein GCM10010174_05790 [Kutzneria viridogrisea]|uniref:Zn-dependent protease with chaperone function n=1 Tax=Kutzneria viridogrisea TaxID=47990 RepID=A0ABR6BBT9_9PSEU|nr:Zn-dependent protease with chaperone function [Kutzneria viridogrisea]